jgi:hypothetical protein
MKRNSNNEQSLLFCAYIYVCKIVVNIKTVAFIPQISFANIFLVQWTNIQLFLRTIKQKTHLISLMIFGTKLHLIFFKLFRTNLTPERTMYNMKTLSFHWNSYWRNFKKKKRESPKKPNERNRRLTDWLTDLTRNFLTIPCYIVYTRAIALEFFFLSSFCF